MKIEASEKLKATCFIAYYSDFASPFTDDRKGRAWKDAYFTLLSWKNTWEVPLLMDIESSRKSGAYLRMIVKAKDTEMVRDYLHDLGYRANESMMIVEIVEPEFNENVDEYFIEY